MTDYLPFPSARRKRRRSGTPVHVEVGRRSAWLHGAGLAALLDEAAIPRMRCPRHKCLTIPVDRADDLIALLEHREGRHVEVEAVDR